MKLDCKEIEIWKSVFVAETVCSLTETLCSLTETVCSLTEALCSLTEAWKIDDKFSMKGKMKIQAVTQRVCTL